MLIYDAEFCTISVRLLQFIFLMCVVLYLYIFILLRLFSLQIWFMLVFWENKSYYHALLQADGTRKDKANRRLHVPVSENIYGAMNKAEILEAQEKELQLADQDRTTELIKDNKNQLESYIYETRSKVHIQYLSDM